ncbi:MAG: hypothetical protein JNM75_05650 [Rhodospirillales bacterium]|nr:hypothetical protein [Rhodospirillales bacterium]
MIRDTIRSAARPAMLGALFASAALALPGCGSISDAANAVGLPVQDWSDVRVAREPEAELVEMHHSVRFAAARYGLDRDEMAGLQSFLARADIGYGDRVFIVAPSPDQRASGDAAWLGGRRAEAVKAFLSRERIRATIAEEAAATSDAANQVTVYVRRYVAVLPPCPDWSDVPAVDFNNQPMSNWSCASAVNFGMMLADPGDLVRGSDPGYADGEAAARTIENYRKGKSKNLIRDASAAEVFPDASGQTAGGE